MKRVRAPKWAGLIGLTVAWAACGPPPPPAAGTRPPGARAPDQVERARSGSLRQDQISVRMAAGELLIEVTPLAAWVLEAAAPDTRDRLMSIAAAQGGEARRLGGDPDAALFLVSFTSRRPGAEFRPDDLHLVSRGLRERPAAIHAITPGWGMGRLEQQASAQAVYAYSGGVELTRDLAVAYQGTEDRTWSSRLAAIEAERARIARSPLRLRSAQPAPSSPRLRGVSPESARP